ncbi:hypothetical protein [Streptomyces sp. NPDC018045]|uniref:hypothetical protein n=1 Tax=Streptomyces sp. NPDC018045 TaxID=3365037 RepID=UPI00378FA570
MRIRGFVAAGVAATATVAFCGSPAFAGQDAMAHTTDHAKDWGGKAMFNDDGDVFRICDLKADARVVTAVVKIADEPDSTHYLGEYDGAGKCRNFTLNMTEGHVFKMKVCLTTGGRDYYCSNWVSGVA